MGRGGQSQAALRVEQFQPEHCRIDHARPGGILFSHGPVQLGQDNDGKLQALAFVDAHYPYSVFGEVVGLGRGPVGFLFEQFFEKGCKAGDIAALARISKRFILNGAVVQLQEVSPTLPTIG